MNVTCPQCSTVYRVDPSKIPARGVRARCARCPGTFPVERETAADEEPTITTSVEARIEVSERHEDHGSARRDVEVSEAASTEFDSTGIQPAETPDPNLSTTVSETELPPAPFGSADPHARARRLARALVSDIAVYNPERRERSLREGNLRREFRDEIRKSWDEYVSQIGNQIAQETSYFRDALNEILAGGDRVF
jgi:predicted Zn finger-like uncharacterized protein